jgi:transcriptional regulator with XRE-family HTH domain/quercetin dioxygenase-like cupin family protein
VPAAVLQIGERIRAERLERGVSLRSLARSVGLSPSLISQIETGKCQPSVSTLYAITNALGVSVADVFGEVKAADSGAEARPVAVSLLRARPSVTDRGVVGQAAAGRAVAAMSPVTAEPDESGPVVCPGQREVLELDSGVIWQRLGRVPGSPVDFLLVTYAPGGCSSPSGQLMQHAGTEYGYLVQGELVVTLGFRAHRMMPGDAVSFASATPHSYRNDGPVPAVGIWFVAEPDGA